MLLALGSIISTARRELTSDEIYCGLFDYYDHWTEKDPRLDDSYDSLSHVAEVFAHDLVQLIRICGTDTPLLETREHPFTILARCRWRSD